MDRFDPKAYEAAVVKPLRRWTGRDLPDDLVSRYAVDLGMSDADLTQRLAEVRSHWNKSVQSTGKSATTQNLCKAFLRADEELKRAHGGELNNIAWWRQHQQARVGARQGEIDELAQTLRKSFGELGLIAAGQLEATMRATFAALAPDEAAQALATAGVSVSTPTELPTSSGLQHTVYRTLRTRLADAQVASIAELLHGEITSFEILESFRCTPAQPEGLTAKALRSATERENKRSDNQAAREALGILSRAANAGVGLRELTLFHLLDTVREHHGYGVPPSALLKQLLQVGLDPAQARQAVFSVLNETAASPVTGFGAIKELLEAGRLIAAQQALATITNPEDATAAKEQVQRHAEQVRQLRDGAHQSLRIGNEADALHQLRQAVALAGDDENLAAELRRIPPPPVLDVSAQPDGVGIRVSWRAAASHSEDTRYRVVRREGRIPADPDDGAAVGGAAVGGDSATAFVDSTAPAGQLVGYAVFAATDGGAWSRPAGVAIEVLPPVHNVQLTARENVVEGRWQVHPDVLAVDVYRGTGAAAAAVHTAGKTAFRDGDVAEGADHVYTLVARYRRSDGTEARSAAMVARTTSGGQALPVSALTLSAVPAEQGSRIAIKWRRPGNAEVTVRRASAPCPWEFGTVVPPTRVAGYGAEVSGFPAADGEWRSLTADVPAGHFWYVPFTLGPSGAVCGQEAQLGIALPMTGLRHQRLGPEVVLAWSWPEQAGIADVRWRTPTDSGRYRLTRQQYQDAGGCRIRSGGGQVDVQVRSVVASEGGDCLSAAAELVVPDLPPSVHYTVDMVRRPLVGGGTVRVRLSASQPVGRTVVLVVVAPGTVMPRRPADGQVVLRSQHDLMAGHEVELTAELPRLRKPYWVRCFLEGSGGGRAATQLIDPPTTQLKVS
ncbi:MAG: hypothetical protein M3R63_12445 [Actinomycetota bacterium]|nr:hypothetical protein [Actinomycetota bacterium]